MSDTHWTAKWSVPNNSLMVEGPFPSAHKAKRAVGDDGIVVVFCASGEEALARAKPLTHELRQRAEGARA